MNYNNQNEARYLRSEELNPPPKISLMSVEEIDRLLSANKKKLMEAIDIKLEYIIVDYYDKIK